MTTPRTLVDMSLSPISILLGQINRDNSTAYVASDVKFKQPLVVVDAKPADITVDGTAYTITRNTQIEFDILSDEVPNLFVNVKYQRIDLAHLFSNVSLSFYKPDVSDEAGVVVPAKLFAKIKEQYNIEMTVADFKVTSEGAVQALESNVGYIGSVPFGIVIPLAERVAIVTLDGFHLPAAAVVTK